METNSSKFSKTPLLKISSKKYKNTKNFHNGKNKTSGKFKFKENHTNSNSQSTHLLSSKADNLGNIFSMTSASFSSSTKDVSMS